MKENNNLDELSKEELIQVIKSLKSKLDTMEQERSIVGESLIKAQKVGEVIQESAEKQAREIIADGKRERDAVVASIEEVRNNLLFETDKLKQIRQKIIQDIERVLEKYQVLLAKERELVAEMEEAETSIMEAPAPVRIETATPEVSTTSPPSVPPMTETPEAEEIDLSTLLTMEQAQPAVSPEIASTAEPEIKDFIGSLQSDSATAQDTGLEGLLAATHVATDSGTGRPVDLSSLLAEDSSPEQPPGSDFTKSTPASSQSSLAELLNTTSTPTAPAPQLEGNVDLAALLSGGATPTHSSSPTDSSLVDVSDLLNS